MAWAVAGTADLLNFTALSVCFAVQGTSQPPYYCSTDHETLPPQKHSVLFNTLLPFYLFPRFFFFWFLSLFLSSIHLLFIPLSVWLFSIFSSDIMAPKPDPKLIKQNKDAVSTWKVFFQISGFAPIYWNLWGSILLLFATLLFVRWLSLRIEDSTLLLQTYIQRCDLWRVARCSVQRMWILHSPYASHANDLYTFRSWNMTIYETISFAELLNFWIYFL